MELSTGVCGICSSNSLILNSENYCNMIFSHFQNELNISSEFETNFAICPMCVYQITLINSKQNLLAKDYVEDEIDSIDRCALCKQNEDIFKIPDTNFLNKCKQWISIKDIISLCASCYYVIEVNNVLKEHIMRKLNVKDESTDNQKCSPKQQKERITTTGLEGSSVIVSEDINSEYNSCETKNGHQILSSINLNDSVDKTHVRKKRRRSNDLGELLDEHLENMKAKRLNRSEKKLKQSKKEKSWDFNLSSISHFSPLCKQDIQIGEKHKKDDKIYKSIPFVKMQNAELASEMKDKYNYVCSLISHKPILQVSRTPPIKIKTLRNVKLTVEKKKVPEKIGNKSTMINRHSNVEIAEQKLVVKVERMKLDIPTEQITAKKKKRVHFNDIPTIIFTDDDYYDDCRMKRNNRMLSNSQNIETVQTIEDETETVEEERSDNEEIISLCLEESDDESKTDSIVESNEVILVETKDPINKEQSEIMDVQNKKPEESEEIITESDGRKDCEETLVQKTQEAREDEKDSTDEGENVHSQEEKSNQESVEKSCTNKNINQEDKELCEQPIGPNCSIHIDLPGPSSSNKIVEMTSSNEIIDTQEEGSSEELVGTPLIDLEEELCEQSTGPNCSIHKDIQKEGSSNKSVGATSSVGTIDLDADSDHECSENMDTDLAKKDLEDKEVNSDNNQLIKDSDTEKDSLDGFEIIDQEDGDLIFESTVKDSIDEPSGTNDNIDEINALVKKYCEEKDTETVESQTNVSETEKINEETADGGDETSQEKKSEEINSHKQNSQHENESAEEDFGSLIDEVQKCLTSTKDLRDKSEENTEDNEASTMGKGDILSSVLEENSSQNSSQTEDLIGNKGIKRKYSDGNIVELDQEKEKMYISPV